MKRNISLAGLLLLAACGTDVDLDAGFAVLDTSPSGGAVNIDPNVDIFVVFNDNVDETTLDGNITLSADGEDGTSTPVALTCTKDAGANQLVQCSHEALANGTSFTLTLGKDLKAASGEETLGVDITKRFATVSSE
ncbi:MAG: Ig-like domain-containing protein [Myxococcota bacterium]|nr:Ig-like domain-containing protein [Myxococcota bacterium]